MTINIERPQPYISAEEKEKRYWNSFRYDSHKWIETKTGSGTSTFHCEYCKRISPMVMYDNFPICKDNPNFKQQGNE